MSTSLALKIVRFKGNQYYECQYTGAKRRERYGIPREEIGKDRRGTFADPACAVAWILDQQTNKKLDAAKGKKFLQAIALDLGIGSGVSDNKLMRAPPMDPGSDLNMSYQRDWPWMMHPKSGYTQIEKEKDLSKSESPADKPEKKFYLYSIDPEKEGKEIKSLCVTQAFKSTIDLDEPIKVSHIRTDVFKSKEVVMLAESNEGEESGEEVYNDQIDAMFGCKMNFNGRVHLIMKKPLHDDGVSSSSSEGGENATIVGNAATVTIIDKHHAKSSSSSSSPKEKNIKSKRNQIIDTNITSLIGENTPPQKKNEQISTSSSEQKTKKRKG